MYTKFGEHQKVDVTKSNETWPSSDMESSFTNPRSVIGSSSSGSVTVERARRTLCLSSSWASWVIVHLERRAPLSREGPSLLRRLAYADRPWLKVEFRSELVVLVFLLLLLDVDAPHLGGVFPEDLLLVLHREVDAVLLLQILREFEVQEVFDDPFRMPQGVVRAEEDSVRAEPVEEVRHHLGEVPRSGVDERHRHRHAGVDVLVLGGDPAEVIESRECNLRHDGLHVGKRGGGCIHVPDIECVLVEGPDRGALMGHLNVDAEFPVFLQELERFWRIEPPAPRHSAVLLLPLRRVELYVSHLERPDAELLHLFFQQGLPRLSVAGVPTAAHDEPVRPLLDVSADRVDVAETLVIEVHQRLRLENRHVDVAVPEAVLQGFLLAVMGIRVAVPHVFLRAEGLRVVIEAIDPTFREVGPQPILLRRVPNMEVVVDDEQLLLLSIRRLGSDHEESPLTLGRMNGLARLKPILGDAGTGGTRSRSHRADGGTPRIPRETESKKSYSLSSSLTSGREEIEWIRRRRKEMRRREMECPGGLGQPVGARGIWSRSSSSAVSSRWFWPSSFW